MSTEITPQMQAILLKNLYKKASEDFRTYCYVVQKVIEPKWNYRNKFFNIAIDDISHFMDEQDPTDLLFVEAPPRTGKTELTSIFGITFLLGSIEDRRFFSCSGNQTLKRKIRRGISRVLNSDIYKKIFNCKTIIDNENELTLSNGNLVMFTTTSSQVPTGEGFHYMFFEDFLTVGVYKSENRRETAYEQLEGYLSRTQNDPQTKIFINNQRLGVGDLSDKLASSYDDMGVAYKRLTFPYQFTEKFIYSLKCGEMITFEEDEFLTERFNEDTKKKIIAKLGYDCFQTQYQQIPLAQQGTFFKREWFRYEKDVLMNAFYAKYLVFDTAFKTKEYNDPTACILFGMAGKNIYILDAFSKRVEYPVLQRMVLDVIEKWQPTGIIIEDKGSGQSLIQTLRERSIRGVIADPAKGSKEHRLQKALASFRTVLESGGLILPEFASWRPEFEKQVLDFPNAIHDDYVDCVSMFMNHISEMYPAMHAQSASDWIW